jgi:hypothetical protein
MSTIEILVFAGPLLAAVIAISFGVLLTWLSARADRRKEQR